MSKPDATAVMLAGIDARDLEIARLEAENDRLCRDVERLGQSLETAGEAFAQRDRMADILRHATKRQG
jgi:hypothetical protein